MQGDHLLYNNVVFRRSRGPCPVEGEGSYRSPLRPSRGVLYVRAAGAQQSPAGGKSLFSRKMEWALRHRVLEIHLPIPVIPARERRGAAFPFGKPPGLPKQAVSRSAKKQRRAKSRALPSGDIGCDLSVCQNENHAPDRGVIFAFSTHFSSTSLMSAISAASPRRGPSL